MTTCPKCGFKKESNTPDCMNCGVIFAKAEQALAKERTASLQETTLNREIEWAMAENLPVDEELNFIEGEILQDGKSYPFIEFLIKFFLFAAALIGLGFIVGAIYFWDFLRQIPFFSAQDRYILIFAIILSDMISVGTLLATSAALTLGRDIANNTRASRECLFRVITSKQRGQSV